MHDQRRGRRRRRLWVLVVVTALAVATTALSFLVPAQWVARLVPGESVADLDAVAFRPGHASTTAGGIAADGIDVFEPGGEILFTTVTIDSEVTVIEWIESSLRNSIDLRTRQSVYGDRTSAEQREFNLELMEDSKKTAVAAALEHLGVDAVDVTGVTFASTVEGGPADGVLRSGEVIVAVDGEPVTTLSSLLDLLEARRPGTVVSVTVEDSETGEHRQAAITLGRHPDEGNDGGFIGISRVEERVEHLHFPFEVEISSGAVGGPSAGLAFTLAVMDLLTPGELTGGGRVAVTGSIGLDGSVGTVGGVAQKAIAAREAGAKLFIVPAASAQAARSGSGDMPVVGVDTLDDALDALASHGGEIVGLALPADIDPIPVPGL